MIKTLLLLNTILLPGELAVVAIMLMSPTLAPEAPPFWVTMACAAAVCFTANSLSALIHAETTENEDE